MLKQYNNIHTLLKISYLQPPHQTVRHTPTPRLPGATQWDPQIPTNVVNLEAHSILLRNRIQRQQRSSSLPMAEMIDQLQKGTAMILYSQTLLAARVLQLEASNKAAFGLRFTVHIATWLLPCSRFQVTVWL